MASGVESAGMAAFKYFGLPALAGAVGAGLGFVLMWPKTKREAAARFSTSIVASFVFGPLAVAQMHSSHRDVFDSAALLAKDLSLDPIVGLFAVGAPIFVLCALLAWWPLGWLVRWMEKRKNATPGQIVDEIKAIVD